MRATDRQAVRLACLLDGSRMSREVPVRFCERPVVKFRRPTHPGRILEYCFALRLVQLIRRLDMYAHLCIY
jgi:hypothetical protein